MYIRLLIALVLMTPAQSLSQPKEEATMKAKLAAVGWRLCEPLEDYEYKATSLEGAKGKTPNPWQMTSWSGYGEVGPTSALRAVFGEPKEAQYQGDLNTLAARHNLSRKAWWFEKVDAKGEREGVFFFLLAGKADADKAKVIVIVSRKFAAGRGSAANIPGLILANNAIKVIKDHIKE